MKILFLVIAFLLFGFNLHAGLLKTGQSRSSRMPSEIPFTYNETNRNGGDIVLSADADDNDIALGGQFSVKVEGTTAGTRGEVEYEGTYNAIGLLSAYVDGLNGSTTNTYADSATGVVFADIAGLFSEPNVWYNGSLACTSCHYNLLESPGIDLTSEIGILAGYDDGTLSLLGEGAVGTGDYNWGESILRASLRGEFVPNISVSPTLYYFENTTLGEPSTAQTFTVSNDGDASLVIDDISLTGTDTAEFFIQDDYCSGQTIRTDACTVDVVFSPASEGFKSVNLLIPSNDPDTSILDVQLIGSGRGPEPDINANDSDGPITIESNKPLSVTISLDSGDYGGKCDWWFAVYTSSGWHYYSLKTSWTSAGSSYTGLSPTYQGALFDLNEYNVLETTDLPEGEYTFFFAIDTNMNGTLDLDKVYFDYVSVNVVENTSPTATLTSPSSGSTYDQGDSITFNGTGYDQEDGTLSGSSLVWTSSLDGQIGKGTSFTHSSLSIGTHTIKLKVTDSRGATESKSVTITVESSSSSIVAGTYSFEILSPTLSGNCAFLYSATGCSSASDCFGLILSGQGYVSISGNNITINIDGSVFNGTMSDNYNSFTAYLSLSETISGCTISENLEITGEKTSDDTISGKYIDNGKFSGSCSGYTLDCTLSASFTATLTSKAAKSYSEETFKPDSLEENSLLGIKNLLQTILPEN